MVFAEGISVIEPEAVFNPEVIALSGFLAAGIGVPVPTLYTRGLNTAVLATLFQMIDVNQIVPEAVE